MTKRLKGEEITVRCALVLVLIKNDQKASREFIFSFFPSFQKLIQRFLGEKKGELRTK